MKNATMLYKYPGKEPIHGKVFDTLIVDACDIDKAIADGWALTTPEALNYSLMGVTILPSPPNTKRVLKKHEK